MQLSARTSNSGQRGPSTRLTHAHDDDGTSTQPRSQFYRLKGERFFGDSMRAEEIRKFFPTREAGSVEQQAIWLREIAAQLAELNESVEMYLRWLAPIVEHFMKTIPLSPMPESGKKGTGSDRRGREKRTRL